MKIYKRFNLFLTSLFSLLFLSVQAVYGQADYLQNGTNDEGKVTTDLANPNSAYGLLGNLIGTLIYIIMIGGAVAAFVFFIVGAIQWGTAGSGDGAANGRKTMLYAAFGMVLIALVYVFMIIFNNILPSAPGYDLPPDCSGGGPC